MVVVGLVSIGPAGPAPASMTESGAGIQHRARRGFTPLKPAPDLASGSALLYHGVPEQRIEKKAC
jgi:hypothetical protein